MRWTRHVAREGQRRGVYRVCGFCISSFIKKLFARTFGHFVSFVHYRNFNCNCYSGDQNVIKERSCYVCFFKHTQRKISRRRCSSVGIITRSWAQHPKDCSLIPGKEKRVFYYLVFHTGSGAQPAS